MTSPHAMTSLHPVLESLAASTDAFAVDLMGTDPPRDALPYVSWGSAAAGGVHGEQVDEMRAAIRALAADAVSEGGGDAAEAAVGGVALLARAVRCHEFTGALCLTRSAEQPWGERDHALLELAAETCARVLDHGDLPDSGQRLDELVTYVANELMGVSATDLTAAVQRVLHELGRYFAVNTCFVRLNDHEQGASVLLDEWPRRESVPDPDPLGVVPFEGADPTFARTEHLREPYLLRPDGSDAGYQERVRAGSGVPDPSMAMVPMLRDGKTFGVLGFVHFGDRTWAHAEIGALQAIASMLVQLITRVRAEEDLHHRAYHDELTGLANRRTVHEHIAARLAEEPGSRLALLFIDMDRLKTMNDVLGHAAGDVFIQGVARRLVEQVRGQDMVARLSGDEFVVVAHDVESVRVAEGIAHRLLRRITDPLRVGGHAVSRTASIGIAIASAGMTADELLRDADVALLEAKARGGNLAVRFNDDLRARIMDRSELELRLHDAIADQQMRLYFQPEYDLRTGEITAMEALVRWQHPERGLMAAGEFVGVAEEINIAAQLGRWVLEEACRQLALWKSVGPQVPVLRVNVSAAELISSDFVTFAASMLTRYGHRPHEVCFEITESAVMHDLDQVLATLRSLRELGVTLAIDDFGTGYSSLAQLGALPVDVLKIDRSFVATLAHDDGDRAIVQAIVQLARAFDLEIVAEGVEDVEARAALLELGCHRAQGFLMARPASAETTLDLLLTRGSAASMP